VDPLGLHTIRLLAGLLFLAWLLPFAGHLDSLFGLQGWFDAQAYAEAARLPGGPAKPLGWSVLYLCGSDARLLAVAYGLSIGVLVLFTLGLWLRLTAVLTWIIVASFTASPAIDSDADSLLLILAFYLMIGYVLLGQRDRGQSLFNRLLGTRATGLFGRPGRGGATGLTPSLGANLALRLLQVHLAVVMVTTGFHKLQFGDWWAGVALWYPLHLPFETPVTQARVHAEHADLYLGVLGLATYLTLAWQIGFPLFAWRPRWRPVLLGGAALAWLGTAFVYRLPLLGPAVFIGCLGYVTPAGWHRLVAGRVPGLPLWPQDRTPLEEKGPAAASLVTTRQV
jgi:hypothetical protein